MLIDECLNHKQIEKLKKLLTFLHSNNIYYSNLLDKLAYNSESNVKSVLKELPIITKEDIKSNYDKYISKSQEIFIEEITSGSTGVPLKCVKTSTERSIASIALWKERRKWDSKVNVDNFFSMYGYKSYSEIGNFFNFEKLNMINCFDKMIQTKPRWICGPLSAIEKYAKLIEKGDIKYSYGTIKFIELIGEYVDENTRNYIEKIFDCKTINHYGARECWCVAYECPEGNMHVLDDNFFVETINQGQFIDDKEIGEVIITSFYNKLMPVVRYNIKDLGKVNNISCKCGKKSQVINLVGGRTADILKGKKEFLGDIFFKRVLNRLIIDGYDCIDMLQVEQIKINHFILYIKKNNKYTEAASSKLVKIICDWLEEEPIIEMKFVNEIKPLHSGKLKLFRSYVK